MDIELRYTDEEVAVIDGVIASICPRMPQESLQNAFRSAHEHLHEGNADAADLRRIISALEFTDPGQCTSCSKESYRNMTNLLLKTKAMLRAAI
ncbi:MAG: hypothetical protein IJV43_02930 [Oscillospiraceae bacterium]|nr:hypothetical protein [Oscillospiraceae bacterium]MBQ9721070.1 hypothetical protein [Oscillospiraceae bacterium]